jgi:hypothetical protein
MSAKHEIKNYQKSIDAGDTWDIQAGDSWKYLPPRKFMPP